MHTMYVCMYVYSLYPNGGLLLVLLYNVRFNSGFTVVMCVRLHPNSYLSIPMYLLEYCAIALHQLGVQ